jgi:hypothetical protein
MLISKSFNQSQKKSKLGYFPNDALVIQEEDKKPIFFERNSLYLRA